MAVTAAKVPRSPKTAKRTSTVAAAGEARKSEFDSIRRRASALARQLTTDDFDEDGNAKGAWAEMLAELDAWAKQHKLKLVTREFDQRAQAGASSGGTARSHTTCPGTMTSTETVGFMDGSSIKIKHSCTLRRTTLLGRCVYSCVSELV